MTISIWLNFGRPAPPGRGSAVGRKFLAPPYYSQCAVFASLWVLLSFALFSSYFASFDTGDSVASVLIWAMPNRGLTVFGWIRIVVPIIQQNTNMNSSANKQIHGSPCFDKHHAVLFFLNCCILKWFYILFVWKLGVCFMDIVNSVKMQRYSL